MEKHRSNLQYSKEKKLQSEIFNQLSSALKKLMYRYNFGKKRKKNIAGKQK
jgi:hypothetical protein